MTDVNEIIVSHWINICRNQFIIPNISFPVYGKKGGSNYSNIDILAVDKFGLYYDYEIKWRSVYSIGASDKETVNAYIYQLTRPERKQKIECIIGKKSIKKIFVTTKIHFGKRKEKIDNIIAEFKKSNIEVIFFEDILQELINKVDKKGKYDSEILQIIRMFKLFNLFNE